MRIWFCGWGFYVMIIFDCAEDYRGLLWVLLSVTYPFWDLIHCSIFGCIINWLWTVDRWREVSPPLPFFTTIFQNIWKLGIQNFLLKFVWKRNCLTCTSILSFIQTIFSVLCAFWTLSCSRHFKSSHFLFWRLGPTGMNCFSM